MESVMLDAFDNKCQRSLLFQLQLDVQFRQEVLKKRARAVYQQNASAFVSLSFSSLCPPLQMSLTVLLETNQTTGATYR